ncbi:hypothetical protein [Pedobacter nyackensis]|uniref:Uncharacterized protein n=1 Tax=Pedobacter nyackensis TaxID=475255 RepID=A0A1W1ZXF1_9SPHI|nr:hypothetical protein [Pedobacter nyackensis]SMC53026.1 hypothetical protein SAMN04488101_101123 [Pedobacter nyackensis]
MKDILQLQEIAGYLPYEVQFKHFDDEREIYQICKIAYLGIDEVTIFSSDHEYTFNICDVKPMLRPCTEVELSKILCINEKKDKFIDYISTSIKDSQFNMRMLISGKSDSLEYWKIHRLLQWHFDIHNLIGRGLAIDINTLTP